MDLAVLFVGTPDPASAGALPPSLPALEVKAGDALAACAELAAARVLFVEPETSATAQTFAAAAQLDPCGGILGGAPAERERGVRFGTVFAAVPFGPYPIEPFALVDQGVAGQRPAQDAIDAVSPGAYLVDREAFLAAGGLDETLGTPWRVYDLCLRLRRAGAPVRWHPALSFGLDLGVPGPADAVDHRDFVRRWQEELAARFDLEGPARGTIRRAVRLSLGQRDVVTMPLPPVDVLVTGDGPLQPAALRALTRVRLASLRDARSSKSLPALRDALRARSDRYLALVDAARPPDERWLERMLVELEWGANVCAVREVGRTVFALTRVPLDVQPAAGEDDFDAALAELLQECRRRGKIVRDLRDHTAAAGIEPMREGGEIAVSVVIVAHCDEKYHRTSFEALYAGDLGVDYHVVATPARPDVVKALRVYPTLDVIVDDSRSLAPGVNAALARARGDVVVVIGDDFHPAPRWLARVREAFALRPDAGIIGFSAVFVDGPQMVDTAYGDLTAFRAYAEERQAAMAREAHLAERLTALAFAVDRRALGAVGGFDPRLGAGRYGVEDLTLRMRAAGYAAYVANDVFMHRFDPKEAEPFANDPSEEARAAELFAEKWSDPATVLGRGFDPARDYVPLRGAARKGPGLREAYEAVFVATCADDEGFEQVARALRRYLRAVGPEDRALFAVGVGGEVNVDSASARARAIVRKLELPPEQTPDVAMVALGEDPAVWIETLPKGRRLRVFDGCNVLRSVTVLSDLSPSGFRRALARDASA